MPATFNASYPAVPDAVGDARREIVSFARSAGVTGPQLEAITLAAGEALANVAMHAYRERPGHIHVSAAVAEDELWVLVCDDGAGLHAGGVSEGLGQGMRLIAGAADGLTIAERSGGGTEVRMRFDLPAPQLRGSVTSASLPASSRFSTTK